MTVYDILFYFKKEMKTQIISVVRMQTMCDHSLPRNEVVLAAIYLGLTQLSDRQGTTKVHMHAAIILLQKSAGLQQALQSKSKNIRCALA